MRFRNIARVAAVVLVATAAAVSGHAAQLHAQPHVQIPLSEKDYDAKLDEVEALLDEGHRFLDEEKYAEAIPPFEKALAVCETYLGEGPYMVIVLQNLGFAYIASGDAVKAEIADKRALEIADRIYDDTSDRKLMSIANLGALYTNLGRWAEAEPLLIRALALGEKMHGLDDPEDIFILKNLIDVYANTGRTAKAAALQKRVDAIEARQRKGA